ncbi:hypothetical protein BDR26DRAFT_901684 [Obelidium mucronatum]|nr:hypothetical protein BDR26DRAFT_901684 [Obelidium mucronatum]
MGNSSFRNLHREHNLAGNRFASVRIGEFDAERVADYHNLNRAPGEPSMTEKEATEAIEEAKRVDHRLDNLFVATDGSERRNKKAAKDLTKEVSQLSGPPHNLKVYLDLDRMHENIHRNMQRNVSSSKYMVAMHNKLYASSRNCGSEFYTAKETGIPMAIVHVGDGPHHHLPADSSTIRIYSTENDTAEIVRQIAESATGTIPPAELINDQELEEKGESLPAFKHADLVATNDAIERVTGKRTDIPPEVKPFLEGVKVVGVLYDELGIFVCLSFHLSPDCVGRTQETQAQELKGQLEAVSPGIEVKLCTVQDLEKGNQLPPKHDRSFVICENLEGDKEKNNMTGLYMNAQDSESVICIGTQKQVLQAAPELAGVTGVPMDNIPKINDLASFGTPQLCFSETSKRVKAVEDILRNFPFGENTTPVEAAKLLIKLVGAGALTDEQLRTCALAENMDPILDVFYDVTNDNDNLHRYSGIVTLIDGLANDYVNKDDFESADKRRQYCAYLVAAMGLSEGASKIIMAEYDRKLGDTTNTQNQTAAVNADNDENVNADEGELAT